MQAGKLDGCHAIGLQDEDRRSNRLANLFRRVAVDHARRPVEVVREVVGLVGENEDPGFRFGAFFDEMCRVAVRLAGETDDVGHELGCPNREETEYDQCHDGNHRPAGSPRENSRRGLRTICGLRRL